MNGRSIALAAVLLGLTPGLAKAADVRASSTTIFAGWQDVRAGEAVTSAPAYELLALEISDLEVPGFDSTWVAARGWARLQMSDDDLRGNEADLNLLYVGMQNRALLLKLGRQHIASGAGRMALIDGVNARVDLHLGLSLEGWFGASVRPNLDWDAGDWQGGTRAAVRLPRNSELGLSFAQRRMGGEIAREEVSIDGSSHLGLVQLNAFGALDTATLRLSDARVSVGVAPTDDIRVTVNADRTAPTLLLARTSIFTVFSDAIYDRLGGDIEWRPSVYYTIAFEGHALRIDNQRHGYTTSLRATTYREPAHRSLIGVEAKRLDEGDNGYLRARLMTRLQAVDAFGVTADAHVYRFDTPINDASVSVVGNTGLTYDVNDNLRLVASTRLGTTPRARFLAEGMLRITYGHGYDVSTEVGP